MLEFLPAYFIPMVIGIFFVIQDLRVILKRRNQINVEDASPLLLCILPLVNIFFLFICVVHVWDTKWRHIKIIDRTKKDIK